MLDWTSEIMVKLHDNKITQRQLAKEAGYSYQYICSVLRGLRKTPSDMPERMNKALDALIARGGVNAESDT